MYIVYYSVNKPKSRIHSVVMLAVMVVEAVFSLLMKVSVYIFGYRILCNYVTGK